MGQTLPLFSFHIATHWKKRVPQTIFKIQTLVRSHENETKAIYLLFRLICSTKPASFNFEDWQHISILFICHPYLDIKNII